MTNLDPSANKNALLAGGATSTTAPANGTAARAQSPKDCDSSPANEGQRIIFVLQQIGNDHPDKIKIKKLIFIRRLGVETLFFGTDEMWKYNYIGLRWMAS